MKKLEKAFELIALAYERANFPTTMMGTYSQAEDIEEDYHEDGGEGWRAQITFGVQDESHKDEYYAEAFLSEEQFEAWKKLESDIHFPDFIDN